MVLILSDLYQEYFNTTYGNLTQYTAVITARSMALSRGANSSDGDVTFCGAAREENTAGEAISAKI